MNEYRVIYLDMPTTIRSFAVKRDEEYTIVINPRLSCEDRQERYRHEVFHIENGDFEKECSVDLIEMVAHYGEDRKN